MTPTSQVITNELPKLELLALLFCEIFNQNNYFLYLILHPL